jgi:type IV pilus assembly protein PilB
MAKIKKKLGELLFEAGLLDKTQLMSALEYQKTRGGRLGSILASKGIVSEADIISVIEKQYGVSSVSLETLPRPPEEVLGLVGRGVASKFGIFPVGLRDNTLVIATADPTDLKTLDDISFALSMRIKPLLALESDIAKAIEVYYGRGDVPEKASADRQHTDAAASSQAPALPPAGNAGRETKRSTGPSPAAGAISQKTVIDSIIDLLVTKGVFTREELIKQINVRRRL